MKIIQLFFLLSISAFVYLPSYAQKVTINKVAKFKPPAAKAFLGESKNGDSISTQAGASSLSLPLKISDAAGNIYKIDSYQFLYRKISVVENEETGKKELSSTISADRFRATPLPKIWIDNIQGNIKSGEQFHFFDIVAIDKQGRRFSVPDLKITFQ